MDNNEAGSTSDKECADKLRQSNIQQFKTLVRMHLLQNLDVTSLEELDEKKLKKLNKKRANKSSCTSKNVHSFEEDENNYLNDSTIVKLRQIIDFIVLDENLRQEGVFRKTGSVARQNELKTLLLQSDQLVLDNYTVHDCAGVVKWYLSDLPEPLLTEMYQPAYQQVSEICNSSDWNDSMKERALVCLQLLFLLLPDKNRMLLEDINIMLHKTMVLESSNKMSSTSLATLFAPHLICPKHMSAEALHTLALKMTSTISFMIQQGKEIAAVPKKLATDIRVYLFEQKRRKTMSPAKMLDESVSETTANTVFTFVDRQKTAEENTENQTDTALAQLYAHIQSLPESSRKKKLIKQFNKENGYGTPLQVLMLNKEKNSSGFRKVNSLLGDTIKRHIFHKNLLSRATKPTNMITGGSASSPVSSGQVASPKSRVLFRSTTPQPRPPSSTATSHSIQTIPENEVNESEADASKKEEIGNDSNQENMEELENLGKIQKNNSKHSSEPNLCKVKERRDYFSCSDIKSVATSGLKGNSASDYADTKPLLSSFEEINENAAGSSEENLMKDFENVMYCPFTSTPAKHFGHQRNSMSPITKSITTQRMSKAMQESIMTPRSRKPLMLPQRISESSEQQSKTMYHSFSSIPEIDEETLGSGRKAFAVESDVNRRRSKSESHADDKLQMCTTSLTNEFKDYLLHRSVMDISSPADLSFSSQPDDFESTDEFMDKDMSESKISKSMLFFLDGNASGSFEKENRKRRSDDRITNGQPSKTRAVMAELDETAL